LAMGALIYICDVIEAEVVRRVKCMMRPSCAVSGMQVLWAFDTVEQP